MRFPISPSSWTLAALFLGSVSAVQAYDILYVDSSNTNAADGLAWSTAFPTVQEAIDTAAGGDSVWVAEGTYFENLLLKADIELYGGFAGDEIELTQRDWTNRLSVLDGNQTGSVIIVQEGATNTTRIDGFTIQNGLAQEGGGIYTSNASPAICNNLIQSNTSQADAGYVWGGGIYCGQSAAVISNNCFLSNRAPQGAAVVISHGIGGVFVDGVWVFPHEAAPTIVSNTFVGNVSRITGGALHFNWSSGIVEGNVFHQNHAGNLGGAIAALQSDLTILNNRVQFNTARVRGGAIDFYQCSARMANNLILGNKCAFDDWGGAGVNCEVDGNYEIINNTFLWNSNFGDRGHLTITPYENSDHPLRGTVANNVIAFGSAGITGGGEVVFRNNCVFGNLEGNYVDLPDLTGVDGNISIDPKVTGDAMYPGFHLLPDSPCIDAGDASLVDPTWMDIDSQLRVQGTSVDIGADELGLPVADMFPQIVRVSPQGDDANTGQAWNDALLTVQAGLDAVRLSGGEVWVQAGHYPERIDLRPTVHLFGGFAGAETERSQRDWRINETILDGEGSGGVVTAENLYHWSSVNGLVITNGSFTLDEPYSDQAAGVLLNGSSTRVLNNRIVGNAGVAVSLIEGGAPLIAWNWISGNSADSVSAGFRCEGPGSSGFSSVQLSPVLANNVFANNSATGRSRPGTSIVGIHRGTVRLHNNLFKSNTVAPTSLFREFGVVLVLSTWDNTDVKIVGNTFLGNEVTREDGAPGGAISWLISDPGLVANNLIANGSSGIYVLGTTNLALLNNCVFGNTNANYQGIADPTGTDGNISVDPLLAAVDDWHLGEGSPCIDAGDSSLVGPDWLDLDGELRIAGVAVDIGADETNYILPLQIVSTSLPAGVIGEPYSAQLEATGGQPPYNWSLAEGSAPLPEGLTLSVEGLLSGTPTESGDFSPTVQVNDDGAGMASLEMTLVIAPPPLVITTATLPSGLVGTAYTAQLEATGGQPPYLWSLAESSPPLPNGLLLGADGSISGTPTEHGTFDLTFQVSDDGVLNASQVLVLEIAPPPLSITTSSLPDGKVGVTYNAQLEATGGVEPYAWALSVDSGPLPDGLLLSSEGLVSGLPSTEGEFSVEVQVDDDTAAQALHVLEFRIDLPILSLAMPEQTGADIAANGCRLEFSADAPGEYVVEYTTDFGEWQTVETFTYTEGVREVIDSSAAIATSRFYRARRE